VMRGVAGVAFAADAPAIGALDYVLIGHKK
jgi:hypothetical protein